MCESIMSQIIKRLAQLAPPQQEVDKGSNSMTFSLADKKNYWITIKLCSLIEHDV